MGRKTAYYVQCKMVREVRPDVHQILVSWIPEKFAENGRYLRLKNRGEWENGWKVVGVGDVKRDAETVEAKERDYLKQRKMSDV